MYRGQQERVVTGLPSIFNTMRRDIVGANDISFQGRGTAFVTIGWGGNPTLRTNLGSVVSNVGVLIQVEPSGRWRSGRMERALLQAHATHRVVE